MRKEEISDDWWGLVTLYCMLSKSPSHFSYTRAGCDEEKKAVGQRKTEEKEKRTSICQDRSIERFAAQLLFSTMDSSSEVLHTMTAQSHCLPTRPLYLSAPLTRYSTSLLAITQKSALSKLISGHTTVLL